MLNREQREAVFSNDVPLIIVAGPGTGKTRTLTHRIAYLVSEKDVSPKEILAITFTNKVVVAGGREIFQKLYFLRKRLNCKVSIY